MSRHADPNYIDGFQEQTDCRAFPMLWTFPCFPCEAREVPRSTRELTAEQRKMLGAAVTLAREAAGFPDLQDLAVAAGVSRKTVGKLEDGQIVSEKVIRLLEPHLKWGRNDWQHHADMRRPGEDSYAAGMAEFWLAERRKEFLLKKISVTSRELAAAAEELAQLEFGELDVHVPDQMPTWDPEEMGRAALRAAEASRYEQEVGAQDVAEVPDAPGSDEPA